jgi:DNA-directed RNA polymerase subunit RPC12/RpoP
MEYRCKQCGGLVDYVLLVCYPPIPQYRCTACGRARRNLSIEKTIIIIDMETGEHEGEMT